MKRKASIFDRARFKFILAFAMLVALNYGLEALAQLNDGNGNDELNSVEMELEKSAPRRRKDLNAKTRSTEKDKESALTELNKLQDFNEVSIIQRKFLPKTKRFQASAELAYITNDAFFNSYGGALRFGYFLSENWGIEADYLTFSSSAAKATEELQAVQNISTNSLVTAKNYAGLNLVMVPIYGKTTWLNHRIVPYDFFFTLGLGSTATQSESVSTYHFGTGQIYGISKSMAFRWDFGWNSFSALGISGAKGNFNTLTLGLGLSYFFPGAKYR